MAPKRKSSKRASTNTAAKKRRVESVGEGSSGQQNAVNAKSKYLVVEHPPYKSDATFFSLNDDCLFTIFNRLSLNDLCSIGQTCQHLYRTSAAHFKRRYKSKVLIIEDVSNDNLIKGPSGEEYVNAFTASSRNVTLGKKMSSMAALKRLAKFYAKYEMEPIKVLRFNDWQRGLMENYGQIIANVVGEVESFTISNSNVIGDLHAAILQHMPKMNRLTFAKTDGINEEMTYQWLENLYPNLKHFAWHTDNELPLDLVRFFFEINPGINFFSLQSRSQNILRQLFQRNLRVNELHFTVTGNAGVFDDLQNLCAQQGTRLHLKFPDGDARRVLTQNMPRFIQLTPYIDGLYFEESTISEALAQTLTTLPSLKILQMNISWGAEILASIGTLEEIYAYYGVNSQNFKAYRKAMLTYAHHSRNLKRIYMRNNSKPFEKFKFDETDAVRQQLVGAGKLKFYFRTDELSYMGALNDVQREYDNIQIERVETEAVNWPLVTEYLTGQKLKQSNVDRDFINNRRRRNYWY